MSDNFPTVCYCIIGKRAEAIRRPAKRILFPRIGRARPKLSVRLSMCFSYVREYLSERKKATFFGKLSFFGVLNLKHLVIFFQVFKSTTFYLSPQFSLSSAYSIYTKMQDLVSISQSLTAATRRRRRRRFRARGRQLMSLSFS